MTYTVYVLYSYSCQRCYTGYTSNLINRFKSHNQLSEKGYTIRCRPWVVAYTEHWETKAKAMAREKWLKSGAGRQWLNEKLKNEFFSLGYILPSSF